MKLSTIGITLVLSLLLSNAACGSSDQSVFNSPEAKKVINAITDIPSNCALFLFTVVYRVAMTIDNIRAGNRLL